MRKERRNFFLSLIFAAILVVLDQLSKWFAASVLKDHTIEVIPGVFELRYHENNGAAFGILQNRHVFFYIVTAFLVVILLYVLWRMPAEKRFRPFRICLVGLFGGAIGNLIDRIAHHYVIDFFYFKLIDFPIFNVADSFVTVSVFVLFFLILLYYKDQDFQFLAPKKKKEDSGG